MTMIEKFFLWLAASSAVMFFLCAFVLAMYYGNDAAPAWTNLPMTLIGTFGIGVCGWFGAWIRRQ